MQEQAKDGHGALALKGLGAAQMVEGGPLSVFRGETSAVENALRIVCRFADGQPLARVQLLPGAQQAVAGHLLQDRRNQNLLAADLACVGKIREHLLDVANGGIFDQFG